METPASDGVRPSRKAPRWSARALMRGGAAFVIVGMATSIVVEILAANRVIVPFTRDFEIRLSAEFVLIGLIEFFIGWRKSRRTGS
jgi:anti-sigma factor RsiW